MMQPAMLQVRESDAATAAHAGWVRLSHGVVAISILVLTYTGVAILMVHPRLYWGEVGNDLTPAFLELKISRNYKHGGWTGATPFFQTANSPISANRTYDIFNQNDAFHPQTILAYGMNGRELPLPHGAPVRLRVETQIGYKSMKYLKRIVVKDEFDDGGEKGNIRNGWAWYNGI